MVTKEGRIRLFDQNKNLVKDVLLIESNQKIDISELSNGVYIYSITNQDEITNGKLIVIHD